MLSQTRKNRSKNDSSLALGVMQAPFGRGAYGTAEAVPVAMLHRMPWRFWYNLFLVDCPPFGRRRGLEVGEYASCGFAALKWVFMVWITKP